MNRFLFYARSLIFILSTFLLTSGNLFALNIYRLYQSDCKTTTGVLIGVGEESITLIELEGTIRKLDIKEIIGGALFFSAENPVIGEIKVSNTENWGELIRLNFSQGDEVTEVEGWGVDFFSDVFVVYSTEGDLIPVSRNNIRTMQSLTKPSGQYSTKLDGRSKNFVAELLATCREANALKEAGDKNNTTSENGSEDAAETSTENIIPAYLYLNDGTEIWRHFQSKREAIFDQFDTFVRRSQYYFNPYLFNPKSNFSLIYQKAAQIISQDFGFGTYFFFGEPFSVQSYLGLFNQYQNFGPVQESLPSFNFGAKAYFLRAIVEGNMFAFGRGTKHIIEQRNFSPNAFSNFLKKDQGVINSINQLAMSGIDFDRYSFFLGTYSPLILINAGNYLREISSAQAGFVAGVQVFGRNNEFSSFYGSHRISETDNEKNKTMKVIDSRFAKLNDNQLPDISPEETIKNYRLNHDYMRIQYSQEVSDFLLTGDAVYVRNQLSENFASEDIPAEFSNDTFWFYFKAKLNLTNKILIAGHLGNGLYKSKYKRMNISAAANYSVIGYSLSFSLFL